MTRPRVTLARALVLPALASALVISMLAAPGSAGARPDPDDPRSERAQEVLAEVEKMLPEHVGHGKPTPQGKSADPGKGGPPAQVPADRAEGADATMALRELAGLVDDLPPAEQAEAERYLARPTDGQDQHDDEYGSGAAVETRCVEGKFCVNYATKTTDKAAPGFVDDVIAAMKKTYATFQRLGYRPALSDSRGTPTGADKSLPDIYLADIGDSGIFGYASIDNAKQRAGRHQGFPGYLVLDNDYRSGQYGTSRTPTQFLQVTAAHEFFHVVQFGYDWWEDIWFMEATATWAETLVYPGIRDNITFLRSRNSPLTNPRDSMDWGDQLGNPYGDWLFFEYAAERWGDDIVRQMWNRADAWTNGGARSPRDMYSLDAVRRVVSNQGPRWNHAFRRYVDANRRPNAFYDDGGRYPKARPYWKKMMRKHKRLRTPSVRLDHLTGASFKVKPEKGMWRGWRLRIKIDGQSKWRGGSAIVTWKQRDGAVKRSGIGLGKNGYGNKSVPFGRKNVRWVEVTVVSASTRFRSCNTGSALSCEGWPKDQNRPTDLRLKVYRS
jgi:hypothetical protein